MVAADEQGLTDFAFEFRKRLRHRLNGDELLLRGSRERTALDG